MISRIFVILSIACVALVHCGDEEATANGVKVKVQGRSGGITVMRADGNETEAVMVKLDALKEVDSNGNEVGKSGAIKHVFNTIASLDFSVTKNASAMYPKTNVSAYHIAFSGQVVDATLKVDLYLFTQSGNFTVGGNSYSVKAGDVKFNIVLENWKFCGDQNVACKQGQTDEVGEYVVLTVTFKGKGNGTLVNTGNTGERRVAFGNNQFITFNDKLNVDDTEKTMTKNHPIVTLQGSNKQMVDIQLLKGSKITYDPTIETNQEGDGEGGDGSDGTSGASTMLASLTLLMAALVALY